MWLLLLYLCFKRPKWNIIIINITFEQQNKQQLDLLLLRCHKTYFTLVIVSISLMDCQINYALRLVLQNVNDLLLIKFLLQMMIIISSSGFNKHTLSQALNLLISLLGKQFAKNRLAMSSAFYFILVKQIALQKFLWLKISSMTMWSHQWNYQILSKN